METIVSVLTDTKWSPYAIGIGIGILSWLSFLISGKPLCAIREHLIKERIRLKNSSYFS